MRQVRLIIRGLPAELGRSALSGDSRILELRLRLQNVVSLVLGSSREVPIALRYAGLEPVDGYCPRTVMTGAEDMAGNEEQAAIVRAVLTVVVVGFMNVYVPTYTFLPIHPFGFGHEEEFSGWVHPSRQDAKSLQANREVLDRWTEMFRVQEEAARSDGQEAAGDLWAKLRVWAGEIVDVTDQYEGVPEPTGQGGG